MRTCFAVCHPLPQLQGGEGAELAWKTSIQAIYSHSQLNGQQALCLPEPLMKLQDIWPWGGGPQSSLGWEGFLLKTATTATKGC